MAEAHASVTVSGVGSASPGESLGATQLNFGLAFEEMAGTAHASSLTARVAVDDSRISMDLVRRTWLGMGRRGAGAR